ncbi:hypothetical protein EV702DRAFT_1216922 [Suillus placidus]|uniref:Uncharacterized protein n=1 Tax=Suillus placidus TaxID=48579 RepID=A0A9P6ZGH8_9AGAM|nr:hypothetical protein EV702DRAFT_1216922 [Suillus placidus]
MDEWYESFEAILALHEDEFVAASSQMRGSILKTIHNEIVTRHKSLEDPVVLPKALRKAIRRYYLQFLTNEDDIRAEEQILGDEQDRETCGVSPEEREVAARPKDAGFYKKELSDWDVAQKLFKAEMDDYDKEEQSKLGVKHSIKFRTGHARDWFNNMSPAQRKEVEDAKDKWNNEGAPAESQAMQAWQYEQSKAGECGSLSGEQKKKEYKEINNKDQDPTSTKLSTARTDQPAESKAAPKASASARPTPHTTRPAESDSSDDELAAAAFAGRTTGPAARPSSAQEGAPAAIPMKDCVRFLKSLSNHDGYLLLVEGIRDLKKEPNSDEHKGWPTCQNQSYPPARPTLHMGSDKSGRYPDVFHTRPELVLQAGQTHCYMLVQEFEQYGIPLIVINHDTPSDKNLWNVCVVIVLDDFNVVETRAYTGTSSQYLPIPCYIPALVLRTSLAHSRAIAFGQASRAQRAHLKTFARPSIHPFHVLAGPLIPLLQRDLLLQRIYTGAFRNLIVAVTDGYGVHQEKAEIVRVIEAAI